jgi:hypothetical protein|tara:strand:+ start:1724 stop:1879 length:156 start_codon:yes stop_codon:yes gene_type:complete
MLPQPGEITKNLLWRMMQAIMNPETLTRQQTDWLAEDVHTAYIINWPEEDE